MNIFKLPPLPIAEEMTDILIESENVRIERIISTGQVSEWYDQAESEFVILVEGGAEIEYEDSETVTLQKGDTLLIPPHRRHRVLRTSIEPPCVWICIFWTNTNHALYKKDKPRSTEEA